MHLNFPRHVSKHRAQHTLAEQEAQQTWAQDTDLTCCSGFFLLCFLFSWTSLHALWTVILCSLFQAGDGKYECRNLGPLGNKTEKALAPHSSTLAWKIPWTEELGRLQPMGSRRVGHNWATSLSLFTFMHWRRKWQPTPVFLPGESQGRGSLVGCGLWGCTDSDTTEAT